MMRDERLPGMFTRTRIAGQRGLRILSRAADVPLHRQVRLGNTLHGTYCGEATKAIVMGVMQELDGSTVTVDLHIDGTRQTFGASVIDADWKLTKEEATPDADQDP